ncbi:MAG TPA: glutamine synthetase family protein [Sedimentisphaerales bacterium]|nr:glutamine synthetase family protein [Sedimentisphaerales bacterium]
MEVKKVLEQVKKDNIKFITLQFTDLLGVIKELIIPVEQLEDASRNGVWFDGSSVEGFARIQESDLFLKPDMATYAVVPWLTENGKTARLICDIHRSDGKPFQGDPRFILKQAVAEAEKEGFEYNVGPEPEFYLFRADDENRTSPIDYGSYFDLSSHEGYKVIKNIIAALENFGIKVETSHHEVGLGQYEIDFHYGPCLDIADKVVTLKYTAKKIAQMHNLHATFMPKPIMDAAGSGMHTHQSLFDTKTKANAFYEEGGKYNLSKVAYNFIAGQIKHINSMCAILCPTVNSYKRLVSGYEAPVYITWAAMNRSALLRIPKWFRAKSEAARIELRCPDPACNPYLAFAVMLKAGLDGIKNNLQPPEPVEENIYTLNDESLVKKNIGVLPTSLWEALDALKKDKLMKDVLGEHLFERYIDVKAKEWDEFKKQVTTWEIDTYLDTF